MNESNNTEWLVQPKRVCQTWFLLLSYLRYKWSCGEETGLISDKTSNPWAPYVEKSIADFERGLTQRALDLACAECGEVFEAHKYNNCGHEFRNPPSQ